jgi:DNA-binding beta-propeller fold protein YncE
MLPLLLHLSAFALDPARLPDQNYTPDQLHSLVSPPMGAVRHNQPAVIDGRLLLAGNGHFELWDISSPSSPEPVSSFESPFNEDEAESHQLAFRLTWDGRPQLVSISGHGVDLWDLSDPEQVEHLATIEIDGIDYGDNTHAVWGVAWLGHTVLVGGTNTGLHLFDVSDPTDPLPINRLSSVELGGVSAGPLFALGDLLVVTTPKDHAGLATVDLSDPADPAVLDFELPVEDSYIGGFYGLYAHLLTPFRTYDVLTDPTAITLRSSVPSPPNEYLSFGDGYAFLGSMRPAPGARKVWLGEYTDYDFDDLVPGRTNDALRGAFTDDQFTLPIGNLLVLSDDEIRIGTVLSVHDTARDTTPARVLHHRPAAGATQVAPTASLALSLSDQIDSRSVLPEHFVLTDLRSGAVVPGDWGLQQTLLTFTPHAPLTPDTSYEVVLPAGGLTDLVGNPLATELRWTFSTGAQLAAPSCDLAPLPTATLDQPLTLSAADPLPGATYRWQLGEQVEQGGTNGTLTWTPTAPGRLPVRLTVSHEGAQRTCTGVLRVQAPPTLTAPLHASPIALDPTEPLAWVVNPDAGTVSAIDLLTLERVTEHPVGQQVRTVSLAPDGTLWLAVEGEDAVVQLDPSTGEPLQRVELGWGAAPYGVIATAEQVWVSQQGPGSLATIDPTDGSFTTTPLHEGPLPAPPVRGLAVSHDHTRAWLSRLISPADRGEVHEVDLRTGAVRTLALPYDQSPDESDGGRGVPNYLGTVAISPDGTRAVVPAKKDNTARGPVRDGEDLDPDNTTRTIVTWLDLTEGAELLDRRVDLDDHEQATAAAFSPLGDLLFVVSQGSDQLDVLHAHTGQRLAGAATGLGPAAVAVTEAGLVLVQDALSRTLSVYDAAALLAGTDTVLHLRGRVPTVTTEPLSPELLLGKQLFHAARSSEISQDGYLSCATCHLDGGQDGQVWDFTSRGEGLRNTIDLRGRAGTAHGRMHWTGNFDEVHDFENDLRLHMGGSGLLSDADFEATAAPLGPPKAGLSDRLDALAAYVSSFDSFPRSPYRAPDGSFTDEAQRGWRLLQRLDCLTCHSGEALTDSPTGARHDVGTARPSSGQRLAGPLDGFDTPTLHGLWASPPYLHDGSAPTLDDALASHGDADRLSPRQREAVVRLLLELDGTLPPETTGCGCAQAPGRVSPLHLLGLALLVRRRRHG